MFQEYNEFFNITWHTDTNGNKVSIKRENEVHRIAGYKILLKEIPDYKSKVLISGKYEVKSHQEITATNLFKVDYLTGEIVFHPDIEGQSVTVMQYYGRGLIQGYAKRILLQNANKNWTSTNLEDLASEIKSYINNNISNLQTQITTNENDIEAKHKTHLESTKAHKAEHITYTGNVAGQTNVKSAIDNVQSQVKSIVVGGTSSDARVSQALVDSESATHATLKDRNDKWEARVKEVEYQTQNAKYTDELLQESNVFTIGQGKNALGQDVDVSSSVVNGQVSDVNLSGRTYPNLVKNSNLKDGLSGWIHSGTHSIESIVAGYLRSTKNTHRPYVGRFDRNDIPTNSKLYIAFIARGNKEGRVMFRLHSNGFATDNVGSQPFTINTTDTYCNTIITNQLPVNGFSFDGDSYTLEGDYIEIKEPIITNLTQLYGVGKEPTLDECNRIFNYIDGIKSTVNSCRIVTTGRNLFNKNKSISNSYVAKTTGGVLGNITGVYASDYINIKASTTYACNINTFTSSSGGFAFYDSRKQYISGITPTTTFTTPPNAKYIRLTIPQSGNSISWPATDINIVQLEEGTKVTPYESYKESITYVSAKDETGKIIKLNSLQNGVKDEINVDERKLIKRSSDKVILTGNENWTVLDGATNTYRARIVGWTTNKNVLGNTVNAGLAISSDGDYPIMQQTGAYDFRLLSINTTDTCLYIRVERAKIENTVGDTPIDKIKNYLNQYPITLTYQLAEPKVYDIEVHGNIESFPNGTVYIDPYIKDVFKYSTNIVLPYPVSQVDRITTLKNGELVEIDLSTVTLAADSKTITITGATTGQAYNINAPIKSEESTRGTIKYKAPLNTSATIMDTNALSNRNKKDIDYVKDLTNAYIIQNEYELALTKARLDTIETKINTP